MAGQISVNWNKVREMGNSAAKQMAREKADQIAEVAYGLCPKDTGNLANSIGVFQTARGYGVRATGRNISQVGLTPSASAAIEARGQIKYKTTRIQRELGDITAGTKSSPFTPHRGGKRLVGEFEALSSISLSTRREIGRRGPIKIVSTGNRHNYAKAVEFGSPGRKAQPFLLPALKNAGGR